MMITDTLGEVKQRYEISDTFTGSDIQPGPLVGLSPEILNMEKSGTHGRSIVK